MDSNDNIRRPSRNRAHRINATNPANPIPALNGELSEGEGIPVAYNQTAILTERRNGTINRNNWGEDRPSANSGTIPNDTIGKPMRKTGRVG